MARNARSKSISAERLRLTQSQSGAVRGLHASLFVRDYCGSGVGGHGPWDVGFAGRERRIAVAAGGALDEAGVAEQKVGGLFSADGALFNVWDCAGEGAV